MKIPKINHIHLFWGVYIAFLFVLWPQAAWTIGQFQDVTGTQWTILGVQASPLAWALSGVFEATIVIVTHRLNIHWMEMPHRYKAADMGRKRFAYRWLNVYAVALIVAMVVSAIANFTHVVEFTNTGLKIFTGSQWAVWIYQVIFGLALPGVSFVFARVLSTMRESEQEDDPAFVKAKAELKEANSTIRSLQQTIRQTEQTIRDTEQRHSAAIRQAEHLLEESEQRYRAVGDVVRWLFGTTESLRDRVRGVRTAFPKLSQNGIAQVLGCSVSTVNDALDGFQVELPETVDVQS
jgi:uncharacterized protein YukE